MPTEVSATGNEILDFLASLEKEIDLTTSNDHLVPPGERVCPIYQKKMEVDVQYGIHVDVFQDHGMWLDRSELGAIASFVRSGERVGRREAVRKPTRDGKLSGTIWGAWSLMFD